MIHHCRQLTPAELNAAYQIAMDAAAWLEERQLPAWRVPYAIYAHRQHAGENHGLFVEGRLRAVVTLATAIPDAWAELVIHRRVTWLATLASIREPGGQHDGQALVGYAEQHARARSSDAIYLDCYYGDGRLPRYYERLGYVWLERKQLVFDDGSCHDSVLMRNVLVPKA